MTSRAFKHASEQLAALWEGPHAPGLSAAGQRVRLTHPFGHSVDFDLTRHDLADMRRVLAAPLAELRKRAS